MFSTEVFVVLFCVIGSNSNIDSISLSNKSILNGLLYCGRKISIIDPRIANSDLSLTIDVLSYPSLISDEIKFDLEKDVLESDYMKEDSIKKFSEFILVNKSLIKSTE